jgi:peptidyl-prolyl cis-trans isomerase C
MAKFAGFGAAAALGMAVALSAALPGTAADVTIDTVVGSVNGTNITLGEMIAMQENLPDQYKSLPDEALYKGILEQLIQQTALNQSMEGKLTKHDTVMLENQRRAYIAGAALQGIVATAVTDATLQAAYDQKYSAATPATEYNASHILVASEDEAKQLKARIDGGADFAELAKTNSTDGSAAGGGSLGWFGVGMMVKPFEDAVVVMKPGEVAGPIQTQFGWHLIKLNETRAAALPQLDDVRDELAGEIEQAAIESYLATLTSGATITRAEGIDPKSLRDQTLFDK